MKERYNWAKKWKKHGTPKSFRRPDKHGYVVTAQEDYLRAVEQRNKGKKNVLKC